MCKKFNLLLVLAIVVLALPINTATAKLIGWWKFDDGQGTVAVDSSGNGLDGTLIDNPIWDIGMFGGALRLWDNGYIGHVELPSMPEFTPEECTLTGWIY